MFNSIGSSSNFARAGKSAADETVRAFAASRRNAPKYDEMAEDAVKMRSKEKIAAMKAEMAVAKAGIKAKTDVKTNQLQVDSELNYKMAKRKAGVLATAGSMFSEAGGLYWDSKDRESMMRDTSDSQYENPRLDAARDAVNEANQDIETFESGINPETGKSYSQPGVGTPDSSSGDNTGGTGSSSTSETGGGTTVSTNISAQHSAEGTLSKEKIRALAKSVGFNDQAASTVVGIAGGESGFDPTNSTVRSGLHARTGEDSVGLMQINWGYHKDSGWLQKLGITKREDLFDPVKNLKAAKYLYDGRGGGFQDWTVYNKGIYKDYL